MCNIPNKYQFYHKNTFFIVSGSSAIQFLTFQEEISNDTLFFFPFFLLARGQHQWFFYTLTMTTWAYFHTTITKEGVNVPYFSRKSKILPSSLILFFFFFFFCTSLPKGSRVSHTREDKRVYIL